LLATYTHHIRLNPVSPSTREVQGNRNEVFQQCKLVPVFLSADAVCKCPEVCSADSDTKSFVASHGALGGVPWPDIKEEVGCVPTMAEWMNKRFENRGLVVTLKQVNDLRDATVCKKKESKGDDSACLSQ
jgi:hypothetical protein